MHFCQSFQVAVKKIQTPWTIQFYVEKNTSIENILWSKKHKFLDLAMFSKKIHGYYLDSSGTQFFFADTIWILFWDIEKWIVGPLGQAINLIVVIILPDQKIF